MTQIRYSPRPPAEYVRIEGGVPVGPGTDKNFANNLAAWNLYFLSFLNLEESTIDQGRISIPRGMDPVAPLAYATATMSAGPVLIADLVVNLPPADFIAALRARPHTHLPLARFYGADTWLTLMHIRSALYRPGHIQTPDGRVFDLTKQQDGTTTGISTNILPLARVMEMKFH